MQDFTLDKGKLAIAFAGLFCLFAVYAAITEFKLPNDAAQAVEPAQAIVELDPVNIQLLTQTTFVWTTSSGCGQYRLIVNQDNQLQNQDEENATQTTTAATATAGEYAAH